MLFSQHAKKYCDTERTHLKSGSHQNLRQNNGQKKAGPNTGCTRTEKDSAQEAYLHANRVLKKSIKAGKRNFVNQLATEAKKAARIENMRSLYNTTKILSGKFPQNRETCEIQAR